MYSVSSSDKKIVYLVVVCKSGNKFEKNALIDDGNVSFSGYYFFSSSIFHSVYNGGESPITFV